ncbi:MAG: sodium/proline symporter PutP [Eubacteriaceae bacterium]|nr:sodium/proline symporter PutP [Eubacteriaceae bacterium]MDD4507812.1 sodium/proline symporter PutP [Eubacteriaceae bacterium]
MGNANPVEFWIFVAYLGMMLAIGIKFYSKTESIEGFLLGGRGLGSWVTAFSAQASDMSGWLLMGLPGAIYLGGMPQLWIGIGLFIGTCLNWKFVAARLRVYTEETNSLTLSTFFKKRFKDPTGLTQTISALIILIFFTVYSASGMVASGKLFQTMFGIDYTVAVLIGAAVIVSYTFLGGFLAVCWTDLIQGILMVIAITVVPVLSIIHMGGLSTTMDAMASQNLSISLFGGGITGLTIFSAAAWGLGYFGQPHILVRFMGIENIKEIPKSMKIAIVWCLLSLTGAVMVGLLSISLFPGLTGGSEETVFILMIRKFFPAWIGGVFLAAILAAIMSTIDSQLLVCSSALTEDLSRFFLKKELSEKQSVVLGRVSVLVIAIIALFIALGNNSTVMGLVSYAWGGFGAAFGPLVLFGLYSKKINWKSALAGMLVGTITVIIWKMTGLGDILYEIVPGFFFNALTIVIMDHFIQPEPDVVADFEKMVETIKEKS